MREQHRPGLLPRAAHRIKARARRTPLERKQIPHRLVLHRDVQVCGFDADVGVSGGIASFGKRAAAGKRVADERVPPVVNRQRSQTVESESPTCRAEPLS